MPHRLTAVVLTPLASALLLAFGQSALAIDLTVGSIQVNQAVQFGATDLIGNNTTWVRATIETGGVAVSGVDAALRMSINGIPVAGPPIFSLNGPITAPAAPNLANINDTLNFAVIAPISNNVNFVVEVNPNRNVVETSYTNNSLAANKVFECRKTVEVAYVPVNYTFEGPGLPPTSMMEPGVGDNFLRAIYHPNEWNYHKSPLPPLNWTLNIDSSTSAFHTALADIRTNQLPAAGYPVPAFIYAWLAGNPFNGNGQAGGIPGTTAFGNTDISRFQRTFAHELGHCFGRSHNSLLINTVGIDVEHHLWNTQSLAQLFPTTRNDIMVAGLLTHEAFVAQLTYDAVHNTTVMQCVAFNDEPEQPEMPVLRVAGSMLHEIGAVEMYPVTSIARGRPDPSNPDGDLKIAAFDAAGNERYSVLFKTGTARESCEPGPNGEPVLWPETPIHVLIPATPNGFVIHQIKLIDRATGQILASQQRSPNAPSVRIVSIAQPQPGLQQPQPVGPRQAIRNGRVLINWTGADLDGDPLSYTLIYSPNGGAEWLPLAVNLTGTSFEFGANDIPASKPGLGRLKLQATDGLNSAEFEMPMAMAGANPPETFLLTPNDAAVFPQKAPIAFHATSWDIEDRVLSGGQITWTSSINGPIGIGQLFINSNLSPGTHIITVKGTDTSNDSTSKQISITITARVVISPDCNNNGVLDIIDISNGTSTDTNGNSIPDECEPQCPPDITHNNVVNVDDLLAVINAWGPCVGPCPPHCAPDITHNCVVNVDDLLAVINAWGPCP